MTQWSSHTKFTFTCDADYTALKAEDIARKLYDAMNVSVVVSTYNSYWEGLETRGYQVVWLAPCSDQMPLRRQHIVASQIEIVLKDITGNKCIMPMCEMVKVRCSCESVPAPRSDHTADLLTDTRAAKARTYPY